MKNLMLFFSFLLLINCKNAINNKVSSTKNESEKISKSKTVINKENEFDKKCVIIFIPDSLELKELEKNKSEEELAALEYDKTEVMSFLEDKDITVYVKEDRFYNFVMANGEKVKIDKKQHQNWGIILFRPEKDPKIIFLNQIFEEYDTYFNQ